MGKGKSDTNSPSVLAIAINMAYDWYLLRVVNSRDLADRLEVVFDKDCRVSVS